PKHQTFTDKIHPDDYDMAMQAMHDLISGENEVYDVNYRIQHKNGDYIWFHDKGRIISRQDNGEPLLIEGVATEISEIKQLEQALGESNKQFMEFFQEAPDAYYLHLSDGTLVDANKMAEKLTGYQKKDFIGKSLLESPLVDDADKNMVSKIIEVNRSGEISGPHELKLNTADGDHVYVSIATQPIKIDGKQYILGIARDISERVSIEKDLDSKNKQFRTFFNSNPSPTFVWKREGNDFILHEVNSSALEATKNDAKNYIGKSVVIIYAHVPQVIEKLHECYSTQRSLKFEAYYKSKSTGGYEWIDYKLVFQDANYVLMYADIITDRKKFEKKLKENEARSRALLNVIPDLMFRLDSESKILDYKADKKDLYTQHLDDLRGVKLVDYLPKSISEQTLHYIHKALKEGEIQYYTYLLEVPGNGMHSYEARMIPSGEDEVTAIVRDVTEWERTKKSLQESEARSKALLEAIPDLMFRLDKEGKYLDYSAPDYMLIVQDESLVGKSITDVLPEKVAAKSLNYIQKAISLNKMQVYEYELDIPGKGRSYFEARIMPVANEEVIALIRDVTIQMESLRALAESEEKFRLIAENTTDAIYIFDGETQKINYVSPSILYVSGYTPEEELGRGQEDIYELIHPEDRKELFDRLFKTIEDKEDYLLYTYRMFHKNGSVIWRQDSARFIYDEKGNYLKSYVIARNITKQKEEEQELIKLRAAIEQSSAGIIITDLNGVIEYANPGICKMTGYKREELLGHKPSILSSGKNSLSFYQNLWKTIVNGKNWSGEFHNKRKNGELYWESSIISPIKNEDGVITHFVGIKEDITELKILFQELELAKEKAEESDKLKSAFLTNMSHEIRTPMNAMVGFSTLVSSKKLSDEKLNKYSKLISRNASQLLNVINDILDISKIESNQVELFYADINVNQELHDISHIAESMLDEKKKVISLKVSFDAEMLIIKTDIVRFRQIMMNLISNAIKFTNRGQIKFGYRLKGEELTFFVKDTGLGIPVTMHETIFERFQQAKHQTGAFFGGTGLGLSIAKTYTEMLGGSIWLDSEEGKGTTFYFTLPIKPNS
ncbi:MAG: hypothetical protein C0599_10015, partial [Salinivirgaceae bacterium]